MQIGALNRSIWAASALLAALALAPAHAAPQSREDTTGTADATADDGDVDAAASSANAANAALQASPSTRANTATAGPAASAKPTAVPAAAPEHDLGRSVRDVTKPVLEELAHSDVAEAVRALDVNKTEAATGTNIDDGNRGDDRDPTAHRRAWDGTGERQAQENSRQSSANRDPERDKARASMLLSGLIDEIKPWVFGAAVLYVLAYIAKFTLAARRRTAQRRLERRKHNRRRSSSKSQHGRP